MQYWRSTEQLLAYAKSETNARDYENVYANMPPFGLGAVGSSVKAEHGLASATKRLAATDDAPAPVG